MTVTDLDLALTLATTDAQRKALLDATPWQLREELAALKAAECYQEMITPPTGTLLARLDAAPDDAARTALIRTAKPKDRVQLASDVRWRNASPAEAASMYLALIDVDTGA
jgi:hypothetical protein